MLHREGYRLLGLFFILLLALNLIVYALPLPVVVLCTSASLSLVFYGILLQFFRNPGRKTPLIENAVFSPADGKVVVIEEVTETEYFKDRRIQVSVFMSPFNVHVNRYPIAGVVTFVKYHPGSFLVAWHPKSSTENERNTVVVRGRSGSSILFRQIAGALAKRIKCYSREGEEAQSGAEMGFIKFGSRVDVFLPTDSKVRVKLGEKVRGGESVLADL